MNDKDFKLYQDFGDKYDLHTPSYHYKHDHDFIIKKIKQCCGLGSSVLDIGCGTGVFLEKALSEGLDPYGVDPALKMLELAEARVGKHRLRQVRMQDLVEVDKYDSIVYLSWSINYCLNSIELEQVLSKSLKMLKSSGLIIIQSAHAPNANVEPQEYYKDIESGPGGDSDITLKYRFWSNFPQTLEAEYQFSCESTSESFQETHRLNVADANLIADTMCKVGFKNVKITNDYSEAQLSNSISPFISGTAP